MVPPYVGALSEPGMIVPVVVPVVAVVVAVDVVTDEVAVVVGVVTDVVDAVVEVVGVVDVGVVVALLQDDSAMAVTSRQLNANQAILVRICSSPFFIFLSFIRPWKYLNAVLIKQSSKTGCATHPDYPQGSVHGRGQNHT